MFVKICGITRESDALLAVAMGADAVGFNFVAGSRRQIAPTIARDIARRLPAEILTVGIFRDEVPTRVVDIVHQAGLRAAQLHGHETPEDTAHVKGHVSVVIKAFTAGDPHVAVADTYGADAIMLDAAGGGSGRTFDWDLVRELPSSCRLLLAGGLTPDNVSEAIAAVRPWGVDVASGVESERGEPGEKDARKVKAFVERAKTAAAEVIDDGVEVEHGPYDWMADGGDW